MEAAEGTRGTRSVYEVVTRQILEAMEAGAGTFEMPWHQRGASLQRPTNARTKNPYGGVNVLALWATAIRRGYASGYWASYRQWKQINAQVRRGEKGTTIVFYKRVAKPASEGDEEGTENGTYLVARASTVFNAEQVDGWTPPETHGRSKVEPHEQAAAFVECAGAEIRHGGDAAYYSPVTNRIQMPDAERFTGTDTSDPTESYYATLLHELVHWSGSPERLDRRLKDRFGSSAYAMEELVAELGAAFLCADLQVTNSPRADHAAYLQDWLSVLRNDKKAIFTASSKAARAAEYLFELAGAHGWHDTPAW